MNRTNVKIGDWVWFKDPTIGNPYLPKRGVIVGIFEYDKVKLVNSDGYYSQGHNHPQTEFVEYLTAIIN